MVVVGAADVATSPEGVGDDSNFCDLVDRDDDAEAEDAERCDRDESGDDCTGQRKVLQHDGSCSACVVDEVVEVDEAVAHDGDVGRFDGHVGAGGSHGNADVGGGERRGVVDPVADHHDRAVRPKAFDHVGLFGR